MSLRIALIICSADTASMTHGDGPHESVILDNKNSHPENTYPVRPLAPSRNAASRHASVQRSEYALD